MRAQLISWQWQGYGDFHRNRSTLSVHAVAVPLFVVNTLLLAAAVVRVEPAAALCGLLGMAVAFAAQGAMHKREPTASIPFDGPVDVVTRIFTEQFVTFPRFVRTGGFARAWAAARPTSVRP